MDRGWALHASPCDKVFAILLAKVGGRTALHPQRYHGILGRMTMKSTYRVLGHLLLHLLVCLFARTAHLSACSTLLALLIRLLAQSLNHFGAHVKEV